MLWAEVTLTSSVTNRGGLVANHKIIRDWWGRQSLLLVRGVDSELGEGEEAGPFGETDSDGVGVNLVEAVDLHAALGWCGSAEDWMPGTFVEIFNDIFLHNTGLWFGHHYHIDKAAWVELDFPERFFDFGA